MTFGKFLLLTSPAALILPLALSLRFIKKFSLPYRVLSVYVFGASIVETISYTFWLQKRNNLFLLHVFAIWEFSLISLFYFVLLKKQFRPFIVAVFFLFTTFLVADTFLISGLARFSFYAKPIENIIIVVYAICFFYQLFGEMKVINLRNDSSFLVNTAFIIYFSGTFYLFALSNYIINGSRQTYVIWEVHVFLIWFLYSMVGVGLWKNAKFR